MLANEVNAPSSSTSNKAMQITRQYDGNFEIPDIRCAFTTSKYEASSLQENMHMALGWQLNQLSFTCYTYSIQKQES